MTTGKVLIQIAKISAEILRMSLVIEMFETIQYQGQVDYEGREKRNKGEQKKGDQYLCSQLHAQE